MSFMTPNQSTQGTYWNNGQQMVVMPQNQAGQQQQIPQLSQTNRNASQPQSFLIGKLIQSPDDILAKDVLMDGTISLFLMHDLSCVIARQWNPVKNKVDEVRYILDRGQERSGNGYEILSPIMERLDSIEGMLKKGQYKKTYQKSYKKGGGQNDGREIAN